jgi:hypothetical protein
MPPTITRGGEDPMKILAVPVVALSMLGLANSAHAQAAKLFISSDMERGNQAGVPPACVLNNVFLHLEKVVWRTRVLDADGKVLGKDDLKSVVVELQDGKKVEAAFGGHPPRAPTDNLWAAAWIVPADYPTGTFNYKVTATDNKGNSVTWEPFKVSTSQLRIEAGAIEIKK